MILLTVLGCSTVEELQEAIVNLEGATESTIVEGLYLGVAELDFDGLALEDIGWETDAQATIFLAKTIDLDQVEENLVSGAAVSLRSGTNGDLTMRDEDSGKYLLTSEDGLVYDAEEVSVAASAYGEQHRIGVQAPVAPDLDPVIYHSVGEELDIDLSGQGYALALAVVIHTESGEVTYSNEPQTIEEFYELGHPDGQLIEGAEQSTIKLPSRAFRREGLYGVGIAGLQVSGVEDFENINTALSTLMAGEFRFVALCTASYDAYCAALE